MKTPWTCPKCNVNYAPHVDSCACSKIYLLDLDNAKPPAPWSVRQQEALDAMRCRVCFTHGSVTMHGRGEVCPWEKRMRGPDGPTCPVVGCNVAGDHSHQDTGGPWQDVPPGRRD